LIDNVVSVEHSEGIINLDFLLFDGCTLVLTELSAQEYSTFLRAHNSKQYVMVTLLEEGDVDSN